MCKLEIGEIMGMVEELLQEKRFDLVDMYLGVCTQATELMEPRLLIAILLATQPAKDALQERARYAVLAEIRLIECLGFGGAQELLKHCR
jgi:hypothetical protein